MAKSKKQQLLNLIGAYADAVLQAAIRSDGDKHRMAAWKPLKEFVDSLDLDARRPSDTRRSCDGQKTCAQEADRGPCRSDR